MRWPIYYYHDTPRYYVKYHIVQYCDRAKCLKKLGNSLQAEETDGRTHSYKATKVVVVVVVVVVVRTIIKPSGIQWNGDNFFQAIYFYCYVKELSQKISVIPI